MITGVRLRGSERRGATLDELEARINSLVARDDTLRAKMGTALDRREIVDRLWQINADVKRLKARYHRRMREGKK